VAASCDGDDATDKQRRCSGQIIIRELLTGRPPTRRVPRHVSGISHWVVAVCRRAVGMTPAGVTGVVVAHNDDNNDDDDLAADH